MLQGSLRTAVVVCLVVASADARAADPLAAADPARPEQHAVPSSGDAGPTAPTIRYKDPDPVPGAWRGTAGKWMTVAGFALMAGSATVAVINHQQAKDLEKKFYANGLTPADADRYRRVDTYSTLSTALLVAGGVTTAAGIALWSTAPDVRPTHGGATFGVQGRF
jgi:hypothetical protein